MCHHHHSSQILKSIETGRLLDSRMHPSSPTFTLDATKTSKNGYRLNPFRRVAKSARINLNRYWALISRNLRREEEESIEVTYAAEMEQNRINELLEASARASSQNSINSQWEESRIECCQQNRSGQGHSFHLGPYSEGHLISSLDHTPPPHHRLIRSAKRRLPVFVASVSPSFSSSGCGSNLSLKDVSGSEASSTFMHQ